ncbi:MAG TPA: glycosyltransferase family 2 protein [Candidatus Dormibacteraeota bacterium]|nr:glycosyltransferase family 2 protein [Candidatus Dormibacteraeota bacterium]
MSAPEICVIVVTWNDATRVTTAIDSFFALPEVRDEPGRYELVVSDNGSQDGTPEALRARYGDRVRIVENGANLGFGAGCNRAFAASGAGVYYLLNPDAELRPGALAAMIDFFARRPQAGIAGSRIYNLDGSVQESCGEFDSWVGAFLRSSAWGELPPLRKYANGYELRAWGYDDERRVDIVIGAAMAIRRATVERVGAFDERFFLYQEEVDLCKRAADAGIETWFVPSSEAAHEGMGSATSRAAVERYKRAGRRLYWVKHHGYLWYYALCAALAGRYALYAAPLAAGALLIRRALGR